MWVRAVWEEPFEAENYESSGSLEFISPEEVVSLPLAPPLEILPFSPLTKETNPSLSVAIPAGLLLREMPG